MIRMCALAAVLVTGGLGLPARAADETGKKAAELKWAKGVATDFLAAAFNGQIEQAESLISSGLAKSFAKQGETRLREWLTNSIAIRVFRDPAIQAEEIAPDQDEASFKGTFKSKDAGWEFSLRVVKDKDSGKWRVSYFQFREQDAKK